MVMDGIEDTGDDYIARQSFRILRLVNWKLSGAATPRLFKNIGLWIGTKSLERLTKISEHFCLNHLVEKITFSPMRFVEGQPEDEAYKRRVWEWFEWGQSFLLNDLVTGYNRHSAAYLDFIHAQREINHDGTSSHLLTTCFQRLRNLKHFQVYLNLPSVFPQNDILQLLNFLLPTGRLWQQVHRRCRFDPTVWAIEGR